MQPSGRIFNDPELEEVKKWLLNYAKNANKHTPVESVITMTKLNAPKQRQLMRLPKRLRSQQKRKQTEVRLIWRNRSAPSWSLVNTVSPST
jgi:hypothetical protein